MNTTRWVRHTAPVLGAVVVAPVVIAALWGDASPPPEQRVPWTTSRVVGSPDPPPQYRTANAFPKLKFDRPLLLVAAPGSDRLFVAEQGGKLFSFRNSPEAQAELFFDVKAEIKTLKETPGATEFDSVYGLVFHPKFAENRFCFVCYTVKGKPKNLPDGSRVSRFTVTTTDPPRIDPASEVIVLTYLQGGHNGGDLHFGNDGMLYVTTGDSADPNPPDVLKTGQDITDLEAAVLRIDVDKTDKGKNYAIPKDNPFVGLKVGEKPARPEVWAYGFRNPWRMSFDRTTGDLWLGDVGWELWEMVHRIERGGNYGWPIVEARQPVRNDVRPGPTPIRPPMIEIPHTAGASVTGGYVYRGKKFPELVGAYVFGDWETRRIWAARFDGDRLKSMVELTYPNVRAVAFGQDNAGELYVLDFDSGTVQTLVRNEAKGNQSDFPRTLSATGLFASVREHKPAPGVYPFEINAHQWQDYAAAEHLVALPNGSSILDHEEKKKLQGGRADWHAFRLHFPKDAVLVKTLTLAGQRVETQLLHFDGEDWRGYSYAWRDDQTDAHLVPADGTEKEFTIADASFPGGKREQVWTYHSRSQCLQCHNSWAAYALAFDHDQLNRGDQLTRLSELGILKRIARNDKPKPPYTAAEVTKLPSLADPHAEGTPLVQRARAYLHANCGHCHRFGGGGAVDFELHAAANIRSEKVWNATPTRGTFDLPDPKLVAPGHPERSTVYYRMAKFGSGRMPHLGSEFPDERGLSLIQSWIATLDGGTGGLAAVEDLEWSDVAKQLRTPETAIHVARAVAANRFPPATREKVQAAVAESKSQPVRDLFEGYLPRTGERKLGANPRPQAIVAKAGNSDRGKELFWAQKSQCSTCHQIDGKGTAVGPDLSQIGKSRSREELLESILDPSRRIEPAFQPFLLKTLDGRAVTGLLVKRDDKEVVLKDAQNKEVRVAKDDIETLQPARESIMPTGALADLTAQQAADLLEYLASRK